MANLYSRVFEDVFTKCEPYLMHDFLNVRCTGEGNQRFCLFTYKKVFEEAILVLDKSKYNGELIIPSTISFSAKENYLTNEIITNSTCYKKEKIVVHENVIKLANARETERKDRIILIPIDGITAFAGGNADFSMILILQEEDEETRVFKIKSISIFNPVRKDILTIDEQEGCKYNGKKLSVDNFYKDKYIDTIFVNNANSVISFDLTKLAQIGKNLSISSSIFSALAELFTTGKNLCVCKIDDFLLPFIKFIVNNSMLKMEKVGLHYIIGQENILSKVIKK